MKRVSDSLPRQRWYLKIVDMKEIKRKAFKHVIARTSKDLHFLAQHASR